MANFFSKIFGGIKKAVRRVGRSIKKLGRRVKKFVRRAWKKGKEFVRENPWFWQMALTIAMPHITEFVIGGLKTGMSALATGAGKTALDAQWAAYRAGTAAMPTWGQVGQAFGAAAEGATWGQRAMGWTLQAPGRAANSITGAINNGWDWLVDKGKGVFGVGNENALADSIAKNTGTDGLTNFVAAIEEQNYVPPFGGVGTGQMPAYSTDLSKPIPGLTDQLPTPPPITGEVVPFPERPGYEIISETPAITDEFFDVRGLSQDEISQRTAAFQRRRADRYLQETDSLFTQATSPSSDAADRYLQETDSLLAPSVKPITGADAPTSPYVVFDVQGRPIYDAQGNQIQYDIPSPSSMSEYEIRAGTQTEGTTSFAPTEEDRTRGTTLGQSIVSGAMRGARQLGINWLTGMGQDIEGSALGGGFPIDLLAWNNPTIYEQIDFTQQNSGNYYGGAAHSANSQNILPEDPYAQIMKA